MVAYTGYDAELHRHNDILERVAAVEPLDQVLDIGCGTGHTTRQAARAASAGRAFGVDISAAAVGRARELAAAQGVANVSFEQGDAQTHPFPRERFDLVISRFGTMFHADPVSAFANIGAALRPGGRLVMTVWQASELNEWATVIRQCLESGEEDSDTAGPDAFSLSDPTFVTEVLQAAGFTDVTFIDVREPVYYGPDVATALQWIRGFSTVTRALERMDHIAESEAINRLRGAVAERLTGDGVLFDSRAWLVTARRPD